MANRPDGTIGTQLRLVSQVDLEVFYEADAIRYALSDPQALEIVTRDAFVALYLGCPSIGFEADGQPIGGIIFDGEEAHIAVLPRYHGRWAVLLKPALAWLFGLKEEIVVEIEIDNQVCINFMRRNRWECLGVDGEMARFCMTAQGGGRKTPYPFSPRSRPGSIRGLSVSSLRIPRPDIA